MIALTRITSVSTISKGFRLRGKSLEKIQGGAMFAGTADRIQIDSLQDLIPEIESLSGKQAFCYGTVSVPGDHHDVVTKKNLTEGKIARSREYFHFSPENEGILLIDYDPPKGEVPLSAEEVMAVFGKVCPAVGSTEKLIIHSASSHIYNSRTGECLRGAGGLHILLRVKNASEIPEIGEAINARLWLAGLGYIAKTVDGKSVVRSMIDTSVWQPERLSFEAGSVCGSGLEQRRPPIMFEAGGALSLSDIDLPPDDWEQFHDLVLAAKGIKEKKGKDRSKEKRVNPAVARRDRRASASAADEPAKDLTPIEAARVMGALLRITGCGYDDWLRIGMGLKTEFGDAGFDLWNHWSAGHPTYTGEHALRAKWASFDRGYVGIGSVFHIAKQHGWRSTPPRVDPPLPIRALPLADHEPLAETVDVNEAGEAVYRSLIDGVVMSDTRGQWRIRAAQITVGVGKSTAVKRLIARMKQQGKHVTIVVKDKTQCEEYERAGAFWRHGRENVEEGFALPWHCPKADRDGPVAKLGEKEHRLQTMCKGGHCEHGNVYMREKAQRGGKPVSAVVLQFFKERPDLANVQPCGWFDHNSESQRHFVKVVTAAGLNETDLCDAERRPIDYLIIDESVEWAHSQFFSLADCRSAIEKLREGIQKARVSLPSAGFGVKREDSEVIRKLTAALKAFQSLAVELGKHAAESPTGAYTAVSFCTLAGILDGIDEGLDDGIASWEKPEWLHWVNLVRVPLRALAAIKDGVAAQSLSLVDGQLHVTYLHPALSVARKKGIGITILDATLDETAKRFVGGENILKICAHPNLDWFVDPRWFKGAKNRSEDIWNEARLLIRTKERMERETGQQGYVICRRALAIAVLSILSKLSVDEINGMNREALWKLSIDHEVGWYGYHDAAHDEWRGLNCLIWGQHPVPDAVRMQQYADHRACLILMGKIRPEDLPLPDNRWEAGQEVVVGDHAQTSLARLPVQPEFRQWLLITVSNTKIQAAGRSRAARQNRRVTVWQIGGYPPVGLADHGIRPVFARLQRGLSGSDIAALHRQSRMHLLDDAAALTIAQGLKITRDTLRNNAEAIHNSLKDMDSCRDASVRERYIYIYQDRTQKTTQDVNENSDMDEADGENGSIVAPSVWDHEYTQWRSQAPATLRAWFARTDTTPTTEAPMTQTTTESNTQTPPTSPSDAESVKRTVSGWLADHLPGAEPTPRLRAETKRLFVELKQGGHDASDALSVMQEAAGFVNMMMFMHRTDGMDLERTAHEALACAWSKPAERLAARMILAMTETDFAGAA